MTAKKPVKVFWYLAGERGRKTPPAGPKYYGVFQPKLDTGPAEHWSVLIKMEPRDDHLYCRDVTLAFVSDEGPLSSLHPGQESFLFEGRWPVAEGVVIRPIDPDA